MPFRDQLPSNAMAATTNKIHPNENQEGTSQPALKVVKEMTYTVQVECADPEAKMYVHPTVMKKNNGKLYEIPPEIQAKGVSGTIAAGLQIVVEKYGEKPMFGSRR